MNDFTTEILKTLANNGDLNELFRVHLEKSCQYASQNGVNGFPPLTKSTIALVLTRVILVTAPMTVRSRPSTGNFISRFRATATASSSNRLFLLIDGRMIP